MSFLLMAGLAGVAGPLFELIQGFRFGKAVGRQEWHAVINALIAVLSAFFSIVFAFGYGYGVTGKFFTKSG